MSEVTTILHGRAPYLSRVAIDHSYDAKHAGPSIANIFLGPFNDWNLYRSLRSLSRALIPTCTRRVILCHTSQSNRRGKLQARGARRANGRLRTAMLPICWDLPRTSASITARRFISKSRPMFRNTDSISTDSVSTEDLEHDTWQRSGLRQVRRHSLTASRIRRLG
jgi:hypothetical protein